MEKIVGRKAVGKKMKYDKSFIVRMTEKERAIIDDAYEKSGYQSLSRYLVAAASGKGNIKTPNRLILLTFIRDFQIVGEAIQTMSHLAYASVTEGDDFPLTQELEDAVSNINKITKVLVKLIKE